MVGFFIYFFFIFCKSAGKMKALSYRKKKTLRIFRALLFEGANQGPNAEYGCVRNNFGSQTCFYV